MYVFLVVPEKQEDSFVHCFSNGAHLVLEDLIDPDPHAGEPDDQLGGQKFPLERKFFPSWHDKTIGIDDFRKCISIPMLAAVCLGASNGSWYHPDSWCWHCTFEDLSEKGRALYSSLNELYGTEPMLLTFIDT